MSNSKDVGWSKPDELKTDLLLDTSVALIMSACFIMVFLSFIIVMTVTLKILRSKYA